MVYRKKKLRASNVPKLSEILKGEAVPEVPSEYRKKLWAQIKIKSEIRLTEESEHYINLMCLHFGLRRSELILHSINLLWGQVAETISQEQLDMYEDKLEALRLYKLENFEFQNDRERIRKKKVVDEWNRQNPGQEVRNLHGGVTWWWDYTKTPKKVEDKDGGIVLVDHLKYEE